MEHFNTDCKCKGGCSSEPLLTGSVEFRLEPDSYGDKGPAQAGAHVDLITVQVEG